MFLSRMKVIPGKPISYEDYIMHGRLEDEAFFGQLPSMMAKRGVY
jgi:hypothetical protein